MTFDWTYRRVLDKLNKWSSNDGQRVPERVFIDSFNEAQYRWIDSKIKIKEINKEVQDDLQQFLLTTDLIPHKDQISYKIHLPEDYYQTSRVIAYAKKGSCSHNVYGYPREESNMNRLLQDDFHKPSFEWQESPVTITDNRLRFYTNDFDIQKITLVYYRCPRALQEGVDPELEKGDLDDVINITVRLLASDIQDPRLNTIPNEA